MRILPALVLLLLLAQPAQAQDPSCTASGGIVGYVTKGFETITIGCPSADANVVCTCHGGPANDGICPVYPCDAKGDPVQNDAPKNEAPTEDGSCSASGDTVNMVTKGDLTIVMACSTAANAGPFPCVCHEPVPTTNKCRIYACNAKGDAVNRKQ